MPLLNRLPLLSVTAIAASLAAYGTGDRAAILRNCEHLRLRRTRLDAAVRGGGGDRYEA